MNILIRYLAIVYWCALQLRIILATCSFCIYQKNCSVSLQEEYVDPAWILLRAVIYLKTNSISIGPFFLCFKRKFMEKCPPPIFEENSMAGNLIFDDNWASHKVRTLLAYLSFSYVWNKYSVPIKMNISKEGINCLLMPKRDDQLFKH